MGKSSDKLRRFKVTQSLRLPGTAMKVFYYGGFALGAVSAVWLIYCLISGERFLLGVAVVGAFLALIWLLAVHLMSESSFGLANIAFNNTGMVYRQNGAPDAKEYTLRWDDCVEFGIEKTRHSFWVYGSDHELEDAERKNFPENVHDGVYYFNYAYNTWEEFLNYVPEKFKAALEAEWSDKKVQ